MVEYKGNLRAVFSCQSKFTGLTKSFETTMGVVYLPKGFCAPIACATLFFLGDVEPAHRFD